MNMLELLTDKQLLAVRTYEQCLAFAVQAHSGKTDRHGAPYIFHCIRVSNRGETVEQKCLGLIHDAFEDGPQEVQDRMKQELDYKLVQTALVMTRIEGESYENYIQRIANTEYVDAIVMKIHDLADNCSLYRMDDRAEDRIVNRYFPAYKLLKQKLKSRGIKVTAPIV